MLKKIQTVKLTCDCCCRTSFTGQGEGGCLELPTGEWFMATLRDCGLTNYTRTDTICRKCSVECKFDSIEPIGRFYYSD